MKFTLVLSATGQKQKVETEDNSKLPEVAASTFNLDKDSFVLSLDNKTVIEISSLVSGDILYIMNKDQVATEATRTSSTAKSSTQQPSTSKCVKRTDAEKLSYLPDIYNHLIEFRPANLAEACVSLTHVTFLAKGFALLEKRTEFPNNWKDQLRQGVFEVTYTFGTGPSNRPSCTVFFVPTHLRLLNGDKADKGLSIIVVCGNENFNFFVDYKLLDAFIDTEQFCKSVPQFDVDWLIRTNVVGRAFIAIHDSEVLSRLTNSTPAIMKLLKSLSVKDFLAFTSCCEMTYKFSQDKSIWRHFLHRDFKVDTTNVENARKRYIELYKGRREFWHRPVVSPPRRLEPDPVDIFPPPWQPRQPDRPNGPPVWPPETNPEHPPHRPHFPGVIGGPEDVYPFGNPLLPPRLPVQGPNPRIFPRLPASDPRHPFFHGSGGGF